jgi:hypothetical protein
MHYHQRFSPFPYLADISQRHAVPEPSLGLDLKNYSTGRLF